MMKEEPRITSDWKSFPLKFYRGLESLRDTWELGCHLKQNVINTAIFLNILILLRHAMPKVLLGKVSLDNYCYHPVIVYQFS